MKKLFALFLFIALSQNSFSQPASSNILAGFNLGASSTKIDAKEASSATIDLGLIFYNFFFEVGSNLASGKGEYLEFSSSQTTVSNKLALTKVNFGYAIPIKTGNVNFYVIPYLGYLIREEIFEDPIAWDTYYTQKLDGKFLFGGNSMLWFGKGAYIFAGIGNVERIRGGFGFAF